MGIGGSSGIGIPDNCVTVRGISEVDACAEAYEKMAENDKIKMSDSDDGDGHGDGAAANTNPAGATRFCVHSREQPCAPDAVTSHPQLGNIPSTPPPRKGKNKNKTEESEKKEETHKTFKCKFCGKVCLSSQDLGGHMNKHQKERQEEEIR